MPIEKEVTVERRCAVELNSHDSMAEITHGLLVKADDVIKAWIDNVYVIRSL